MIEVQIVLPGDDGLERPFGDSFSLICDERASIQVLFSAARKRTGRDVRLALSSHHEDVESLMALDPQSNETIGSVGIHNGSRLIAGFN